jgi:hypothetical protein
MSRDRDGDYLFWNKPIRRGLPPFLIFLSIMFGLVVSAPTRVIDPDTRSEERSFLAGIADLLDSEGIDAVYGRSADHPLPNGSVRVAPLAGFAPHGRDWGSFLSESWVAGFRKGIIGVMVVVPGQKKSAVKSAHAACLKNIAKMGKDVCRFVDQWLSCPPDKRVFIAFTREDFEYANKVKLLLEKTGCIVFLFLNGKDQNPWADPGMVGEVFAQARVRMVLDSANARGSLGVTFERECEALLESPPPITPLMQTLKGKK